MYCKVQCDAQVIEKTRLFRRVCCTQLVLYLGRCNLSIVLVKREHHGEAISKGERVPREGKLFAALVGPDRADARPDLLTGLVLPRASAMVEDIRWCVWHTNAVSDTASSVEDWQRASTRGDEDQPAQREKITHDADPGCRVTRSAV